MKEKFDAIIEDVKECIVSRTSIDWYSSIDSSEYLSKSLTRAGISHSARNATAEKESLIIENAGALGTQLRQIWQEEERI